jgi:hypothetical protein
MSFLKHLFGKKSGQVSDEVFNLESFSKTAQEYISEALNIIEGQVKIMPESQITMSTGSDGVVMEAARKFEAAFKIHPENPLLHYAYASCLHLSMQYKSAEDEMRKCADAHPNFILAKLAVNGWEKWQSMFTLPPWGKTTKAVHPALTQMVKTSILLAVRDALVPRTTMFLRDSQGDFQDLQALRSARITLANVISPVSDPQVIGIYAKIYDNPSDPYDVEILEIPFRPKGDKIRARYEYLCIQEDIDFVVLDRNDHILVNKRLAIPRNMRNTNVKLFKMLDASEGIEFSSSQFMNALMEHQRKFAPSDVRY